MGKYSGRYKFFAVLCESKKGHTQDGDVLNFQVEIDTDMDGYTMVQGKQSKWQQSSGEGQSSPNNLSEYVNSRLSDNETLSNDNKILLILS